MMLFLKGLRLISTFPVGIKRGRSFFSSGDIWSNSDWSSYLVIAWRQTPVSTSSSTAIIWIVAAGQSTCAHVSCSRLDARVLMAMVIMPGWIKETGILFILSIQCLPAVLISRSISRISGRAL